MRDIENPRELPGFKKKSFSMYFGGGEIWFEHLDGMYEQEELVIEKFLGDTKTFCRPSATSQLCFVLDETTVTPGIVSVICDTLTNAGKRFTRIGFVGVDKPARKIFKKRLENKGFALAFTDDFEAAKEWMVRESIQ